LPGGHGGIAVGMQNMSRRMLALSDFQDELHLDVAEPELTGWVGPACRNCYLHVIVPKVVICGGWYAKPGLAAPRYGMRCMS